MTRLLSSTSVLTGSISDNEAFQALENAFQLLATMFRYPDEQLWQALSQALSAADAFLTSLLGHQLSLPHWQILDQTYTALFCANSNGLPAPPYLSCYHEESRHIEGDSLQMIRQMLAEEGLIADPLLREPEDHIVVILELAGILCRKALSNNSAEAASGRDALLKLTGSLLIMLPPFQAAVAAADLSCVDFYVDAITLCLCVTVLCREQVVLLSATL
jgi:TorA maturation chaperone TorD